MLYYEYGPKSRPQLKHKSMNGLVIQEEDNGFEKKGRYNKPGMPEESR